LQSSLFKATAVLAVFLVFYSESTLAGSAEGTLLVYVCERGRQKYSKEERTKMRKTKKHSPLTTILVKNVSSALSLVVWRK
jgi:hypothetical protein